MINKITPAIGDALAGIADGATVLIAGFRTAGIPNELNDDLIEQGARDPRDREQQSRQRLGRIAEA